MPGEEYVELLDLPDTPAQQESLLPYLGRSAARTAVRGVETLAGLPGDIIGGGINLLSKATGGYTPTHQELTQKDIERGVPFAEKLQLPTSEYFRGLTQSDPEVGQYLEPRTPGEAGWDQIVSDAVPYLLGGGSLAAKAARGLAISSAGNLTKWGAESLGASPLVGTGLKLGSMLLAGMFKAFRISN